jgi:hypothetical protein
VKLKSLLVITLLVIGCSFASAQTFGFGTAGGAYLYCNYEAGLNNTFGSPYAVWAAVDNLSLCPGYLGFNATMVGISGGLTKTTNPAGFALKGETMADNLYDAYAGGYTGDQWDVTQNVKCTALGAKKPKEGWIGFAGASGITFGANYGTLSCTIPGKGSSPVKGMTIGAAKVAKR